MHVLPTIQRETMNILNQEFVIEEEKDGKGGMRKTMVVVAVLHPLMPNRLFEKCSKYICTAAQGGNLCDLSNGLQVQPGEQQADYQHSESSMHQIQPGCRLER